MRIRVLTGERFGALRVVSIYEPTGDQPYRSRTFWNCLCDCGVLKAVRTDKLTSGRVRSCGCQWQGKLTSHAHVANLEIDPVDKSV